MTFGIVTAAIAFVLALLVMIGRRRPTSATAAWMDTEQMPQELRSAQLVLSERHVSIRLPIAIHGDPDQVYRTQDGRLLVVDTKTRFRAKVRSKDIVQLSLYAFMLRRGAVPAATRSLHDVYGYIRFKTPAGVTYTKVNLLRDGDILRLHRRYSDLRAARAAGVKFNPAKARCGYCDRRKVCKQSKAAA